MGRRIADITGRRFGRLTVLEFVSRSGSSTLWRCKCDCGNEKILRRSNFQYGETKSCGCLLSETVRDRMIKHGHSQERLYRIWSKMIKRCHYTKDKDFPNYGGRGIAVCHEWKNDINIFSEWSNLNGYKENLTIDRIDNDKGYCPENCRWVTREFNNSNKRNVINISINDITDTLTGWANRINIPRKRLYKRYSKYGELKVKEYILENL